MTLNIPSSEIKDDITVNIRFGEDGTYRILKMKTLIMQKIQESIMEIYV